MESVEYARPSYLGRDGRSSQEFAEEGFGLWAAAVAAGADPAIAMGDGWTRVAFFPHDWPAAVADTAGNGVK